MLTMRGLRTEMRVVRLEKTFEHQTLPSPHIEIRVYRAWRHRERGCDDQNHGQVL